MATQLNSLSATPPVGGISPTRQTPSSDSSVTNLVYQLLVNRVRPYLTARRGNWFYQNLSLTPPLIEAALNGTFPLGAVAVSGTGTAKWFCLDIDEDTQLFELQTLARQLWDLDCVLFEYSRRGGHLFFFHHATHWHQSRSFGLQLAREAGLEGVEVFPKSGAINAVRMPGTVHPKTGERYPIINPHTGEALHLGAALAAIRSYELPQSQVVEASAVSRKTDSSVEFDRLVEALETLTIVTVYAPNRGKALCAWHEDHSPSLLIKNSKFHCARQDCVWGDLADVERFIRYGTRPPTH